MTLQEVLKVIWERHGRRLWDGETEHSPKQRLTAYAVDGRVLIVHDYGVDDGWEIYIPASESNDAGRTLSAAGLVRGEFVHLTVELLRSDADELGERLGVDDDGQLAAALRRQLQQKLNAFRTRAGGVDRPVRDAHEDPACFAARLAEWEDMRKLRAAAADQNLRPRRQDPSGSHDFHRDGVWMPMQVFVPWDESGVDRENFREEWEEA